MIGDETIGDVPIPPPQHDEIAGAEEMIGDETIGAETTDGAATTVGVATKDGAATTGAANAGAAYAGAEATVVPQQLAGAAGWNTPLAGVVWQQLVAGAGVAQQLLFPRRPRRPLRS